MLEFLVELGCLGNLIERAVDFYTFKSATLEFSQFLAEFALLAARDGRQQQKARPFRHGQHTIHHLGHGLRFNWQAGRRRIGHADPRPKQAHIIMDFRDGADGGARIMAGGFLFDRNRGREPFDRIHIRLLHQLQELPRIGRKAFHIAPLTFRIDGIESER